MTRLSKFTFIVLFLLWTSEADAACSVSVTGIVFGNYDTLAPTPLDTRGDITVMCDQVPPIDVTISISPSTHSGVFNPRQMKHSALSNRLDYNLYTKQNRTTVWGDGTAGSATVMVKGTKSRKVTVYGSIPPGQNVPAGSYMDSLTITITP